MGGTRLICIASDFNKYDEHAVQQINRNIALMRYRYFGSELLLLELVNAQTASGSLIPTASATQAKRPAKVSSRKAGKSIGDKSQQERLELASPELLKLYDTVCSYIEQLRDEVQRKELNL